MQAYTADTFEPGSSVGYLARRVHQIGAAVLEPVFAAEGMTGIQWSTLVSIWFGRGATCAALARELAHDKGAMTRVVDALEERGWVARARDTTDRRIVNLSLTAEGIAVTLRCKVRVVECWNDLLRDWDRGQLDTLIALLQKLRDTLAAAGDAPCG